MSRLSAIEEKLMRFKVLSQTCYDNQQKLEQRKAELEQRTEDIKIAQWVLTEAAIETQSTIKGQFEALATEALIEVFDRPSEFKLEFDRRGGKVDCTPLVVQDGMELNPKDEKGGSVVDVLSFIARYVVWKMQGKRTRPIFAIDEPFKNLGESEYLQRYLKIVGRLAREDNLQIIITTHSANVSHLAENHLVFEHDGKQTTVHRRSADGKETSTYRESPKGKTKRIRSV